MSKIQDRINEINRIARRSRLITTILAIVIVAFIVLTGWNMKTISEKNETLRVNDSIIGSKNDSLKFANDELIFLKDQIELKETAYKKQLDSLIEIQNSGSEQLWEFTKSTNTVEAYYHFVQKQEEDGLEIAPDRILEIKANVLSLMDRTGWVQIKESNGTMLFDSLSQSIDDIGDVMTAKSARSVRLGVIGKHNPSSRNGDVISRGQYVIVLNKETSGNTEWAQIKYSNKS